jgi:transcription elongation factor S-II
VVGKLRTHEDTKVADLAKETVKKWKTDVAGQKKPDTSGSTTTATAATNAGKPASPIAQRKGSLDTVPKVTPIANGAGKAEGGSASGGGGEKRPRNATSDGISKVHTNDKVRDGSIILLYNAIVLDSTECRFLS